ncbi:glycosyltransferase family 4 protein [Rubellimicrobium rubrum]|uniref:Glycosyltransferase family 4 protein n=1 Tax=Rubellimicrobium rubrum TaxID=2585369 RepID=A0A5C4MZM2_9RHOB|nr:glycosyltransferase family 4 protein [Rubellimicrobium rubrum]TNC49629.1 glycosyltransferase family 4 protein [Rubellimicrobium rubrum]
MFATANRTTDTKDRILTAPERLRIAILVDPRFPGGTSSAVAYEIKAMHARADLTVHCIETKMFKGREINPTLRRALDETGLEPVWNAPIVRSDVVVLHNPSCLKFDDRLRSRIHCDRLIVVTHENVLRPDGTEGFDVAHCLRLIADRSICRSRRLLPVSGNNRQGVEEWLRRTGSDWVQAPFDWFNICDFEMIAPTTTPADRRGRLSRPGFEKFPSLDVMRRHFPEAADCCRILGGDSFLLDPETLPEHWEVHPFGSMPVGQFLEGIDFFVYFTHPQWRESFGRVIAEAICAGKVVITDPRTAATFGNAVVASDGSDVDGIIAGFLADPPSYARFITHAQTLVQGFGSDRFAATVMAGLQDLRNNADALL